MNKMQGKYMIGYVTLIIEGKQLITFFKQCRSEKIPIWGIKMLSEEKVEMNIYFYHLKKLNNIAASVNTFVKVQSIHGMTFYFFKLWANKQYLLAIIIILLTFYMLTNIVWKVEITGLTKEMEVKISDQLNSEGLHKGALLKTLPPLEKMQTELLHANEELLYLNIYKKGTTFVIDAQEKLIERKRDKKRAQHLVASKNGTITQLFVKEGRPVVAINDYVKKGDLLVSGILQQDALELEEGLTKIVAAEGEVYANTWYHTDVVTPLQTSEQYLTGESFTKYYVQIGKVTIPIWGFQKNKFSTTHHVIEKHPLSLFEKQLPFQIIKNNIYEKESKIVKRTKESAIEIAIDYTMQFIQKKLGEEAQILKYYVLHEQVENGKVRLRLYISATENIAETVPF